ncbi:MAG TPA: selenocysteine-specific translation elongation factor [Gaiellaceae bacterium]|nr:selenocysteine-specific translation elongation factor [Gaiellaceae bacterium]
MPLTVGTAGHVDHGKTWLVRALTGKDTDRLPEERRRGMSIDLGYAPLELDGIRASLIDVPGHERFVRTMVAGATGIDLFLLAVDAGEGARPQTHEHLQILRLLGIHRGVVAVTKADGVAPERVAECLAEARQLVPDAEAVAVSALTGTGLSELRAALRRAAKRLQSRPRHGPTRLFVDRAFTLHGIGTIATGTLWSGSIGAGDTLLAEPGALEVRVRSVEVHDEAVERAEAGQRVAVALPRVSPRELPRGTALVEAGGYEVKHRLDVSLEELEPAPPRVMAHHGSAATPARLRRPGGRAQLRLEAPLVVAPGDRVLLRAGTTVGAGVVLERVRASVTPPAPPAPPLPARDDGRVRLPGGLVLEREEFEAARDVVIAECEQETTITLPRARDLLGVSRKTAQAILERLDNDHVTLRIGDARRLRRR